LLDTTIEAQLSEITQLFLGQPLKMPLACERRSIVKPIPAAVDIDQRGALLTLAAAGLTIVLFTLTPVTTRFAAVQIDGTTIGRTVGAGVLAIPIVLLLRLRRPRRASHWDLLLVSALGGFVGFPLLFSMGTQRTSARHAALIMAAIPLFTGLIGTATERRLPHAQWFLDTAFVAAQHQRTVFRVRQGGSYRYGEFRDEDPPC
jgi:uncharacterized membrane protein HdeD (DUF308 family)